jgi:hypothetical protein
LVGSDQIPTLVIQAAKDGTTAMGIQAEEDPIQARCFQAESGQVATLISCKSDQSQLLVSSLGGTKSKPLISWKGVNRSLFNQARRDQIPTGHVLEVSKEISTLVSRLGETRSSCSYFLEWSIEIPSIGI